MVVAVKNLFTRASSDFFEEASADNLKCYITLERPTDHLVTDCNEGMGRVRVIHGMAKQLATSSSRPIWIRHNGSVDLGKLKKSIEMTDRVAKKLLTEKGFVKLGDLHIFDRESLSQWSHAARAESRCNPCPVENSEVQGRIKEVVFSPAITLRIQMGKKFDPKACQSIFEIEQQVIPLDRYKVLHVVKPESSLEAIEKIQLPVFDLWFWGYILVCLFFTILMISFLYHTQVMII